MSRARSGVRTCTVSSRPFHSVATSASTLSKSAARYLSSSARAASSSPPSPSRKVRSSCVWRQLDQRLHGGARIEARAKATVQRRAAAQCDRLSDAAQRAEERGAIAADRLLRTAQIEERHAL